MAVIDLTDDRNRLRLGMITRFPPSTSASAPGASELARRLTNSHDVEVEVMRLLLPGEASAAGHSVVMDLNSRWHLSGRLAAQRANDCDVAMIRADRHLPPSSIRKFARELQVPTIVCVDEVPAAESDEWESLVDLASIAEVVVVHSEVARRRLEKRVDRPVAIEVIPHGSPWTASRPGTESRRNILTWGFLAPGMGAERVVRALALLGDMKPQPRYRLIGVTDPGWSRSEAVSYRHMLLMEAERLGVGSQFEVVPLLHASDDLERELQESDVIAVVYDDRDLSGSRILTEAISAGRPVVATAFPGAIELLATGAGTTVAHDDDEVTARAIERYLTDDDEYRRAARVASAISPSLGWEHIAGRYAGLIGQLAGRPVFAVQNGS